ncbi:MAG: helix-turn-helix domain-containing protein [Phycisphaerae bacterium]|nr:helix-turn-helix domain-containing protein [Phycisphaerae bacterium]
MAANLRNKSDFTQTLAVHAALQQALRGNLYKRDPKVLGAAQKLVRILEGERSTYGRQLRMIQLMQKGATIDQMGRQLRCSRRTLFRYLNHLESAGIDITLDGSEYTVSKDLLKLLRA